MAMSSREDALSEPILTIGDFAREIFGVEPSRVLAFFQEADRTVHSAAEALRPFVERIAGGLLKLVNQVEAALEAREVEPKRAGAWFENVAQAVLSAGPALLSALQNSARAAADLVKRVEGAPKIHGHEELLVERLNYHPLMARFIAHAIHRFGAQYADEQNDGRRASSIIGRVARGPSSLAISRRAVELGALLREGHSDPAVQVGLDSAGVRLSFSDIEVLVDRAADRDLEACQSLVEVCRRLAQWLPEPRGRRIIRATAIHAFYLRFLWRFGVHGVYTNDPMHKGQTDEVDPLSLSTGKALRIRNFRPQSAVKLLRSGRIPQI